MAPEQATELREQLHQLSQLFRQRLPGQLEELEALMRQWEAQVGAEAGTDREAKAQVRAQLHRKLHSLAGAAGSFGLAELGTRAKAVELALDALPPGANPAGFAGGLREFFGWCEASLRDVAA